MVNKDCRKDGYMTLLQAWKAGFIPKKGAETHRVSFRYYDAEYYAPSDLRRHPSAAAARLKKYNRQLREDRKAAKEAEEKAKRDELRLRRNMKTRYQWAMIGYIVPDEHLDKFIWGDELNKNVKYHQGYGDSYLYIHSDYVVDASHNEMAPWWRFFLLEHKLGWGEQNFEEVRLELLRLCPEYPPNIIQTWLFDKKWEGYYEHDYYQ